MGDRIALMKRGVLQQVAEPQEMYENPANVFVAGFIGSPPMNMALAALKREGDDLVAYVGDQPITLAPAVEQQRPALAGYVGRDVIVGIRSEDMEDAMLVGELAGRELVATIALVEALGSEIQVHFTLPARPVENEDTKALASEHGDGETMTLTADGVRWIASFAPRSKVRIGQQINVTVDTERMHFFDPETSEAIRG